VARPDQQEITTGATNRNDTCSSNSSHVCFLATHDLPLRLTGDLRTSPSRLESDMPGVPMPVLLDEHSAALATTTVRQQFVERGARGELLADLTAEAIARICAALRRAERLGEPPQGVSKGYALAASAGAKESSVSPGPSLQPAAPRRSSASGRSIPPARRVSWWDSIAL
jgi:hypothetical protein